MEIGKTQGQNTGARQVRAARNATGLNTETDTRHPPFIDRIPIPAHGSLMLWGPWSFCIGAGLALMSPRDHSIAVMAIILLLLLGVMIWVRFASDHRIRLYFGLGLMAFLVAGGLAVHIRSQVIAAPVIPDRNAVWTITGQIRNLDRDTGKRVRLLLDVSEIANLKPAETPKRVRIGALSTTARPGDTVRVKAMLAPPSPPAFPGAYDMARRYWFEQIGGVGYSYGRVEVLHDQEPRTLGMRINRVRRTVTTHLHQQLPGETGAIAAALLTGDRSGISDQTLENFRSAGLGHLLAISGLHMSLVGGMVFLGFAGLFALFPAIGARHDARKPAAMIALLAAFAYLLLSGGSAPTQRAFVMLAIIFMAVILNRRALSIRTISLAALVIAALRPEFVVQPGFQMSFAASLALVAFYQKYHAQLFPPIGLHLHGLAGGIVRGWRMMAGVALTSLVAGIATAPFASWHFHRIALYSLLANIAAMPVFLFLVMPFLIVGLVLLPTGLSGPCFAIGGFGLDLISWIAANVSHLPGAVLGVRASNGWGLLLEAMALIVFSLSLGRLRVLAILLLAGGMFVRALTPAPVGWIGDEGAAFQVRTGGEVYLVVLGEPDGFAITQLAQAMGNMRMKVVNAQNAPDTYCDAQGCGLHLRDRLIMYRQGAEDLESDCAQADLILLHARLPSRKAPACANAHILPLNHYAGSLVYWQNGTFSFRHAGSKRIWNRNLRQYN